MPYVFQIPQPRPPSLTAPSLWGRAGRAGGDLTSAPARLPPASCDLVSDGPGLQEATTPDATPPAMCVRPSTPRRMAHVMTNPTGYHATSQTPRPGSDTFPPPRMRGSVTTLSGSYASGLA